MKVSTHLESICPPVLIIGFRRSENLARLLNQAKDMGAPQIYVALDGPRDSSDRNDTLECNSVVREFMDLNPSLVKLKESIQNLGAAVSVLSACDWVFRTEDFAIIIEDDCFPTPDFFKYVTDAKIFLRPDSQAMLICGTQFASEFVTGDSWSVSSYPLMWGWATTRVKWAELRDFILDVKFDCRKNLNLGRTELIYWREGARRALEGFVDAWDIPLVYGMRKTGSLAILPARNLVINAGNDEYATHTFGSSIGLHSETHSYVKSENEPEFNQNLDIWLAKNFYGIGYRHRFSTRITKLLDLLRINTRKRTPLRNRWA